MSCVEYHQVRSFGIETDGIDPLNLDGELKGTTPVTAEIIPGALKIFA
jgi:diacylglycerol kinase family enzyme